MIDSDGEMHICKGGGHFSFVLLNLLSGKIRLAQTGLLIDFLKNFLGGVFLKSL